MAGVMPEAPTIQELVMAAKRAAVTLAQDPEMRHYSPETMALVLRHTIVDMAGAGDLRGVAERLADDQALVDVPIDVLTPLVGASFKHFAKALGQETRDG